MAPLNLIEVDTLEVTVIIDNEIDIISTIPANTVTNSGRMPNLSMGQPDDVKTRGRVTREMPMEAICCGAHGFSVLVKVTKGGASHFMMFDTGPEEEAWERNAKRLNLDLSLIERIQLSHWHRDHSGGMLRAVLMITKAKKASRESHDAVIVDLHPARPDYRGFMVGTEPISMQADPSFAEIELAGGKVEIYSEVHTVLEDMFLVSGEIPRVTTYENGIKGGIRYDATRNEWEKDESISDERFLMCNLKDKGIVMFTGCSHGGVVNASKNAVDLLGGEIPLYAVIGGFHLVGEQEANVERTVQDLRELDAKLLLPGHCSGWRVKYEIEKELPGRLVPCTVGSRFTF